MKVWILGSSGMLANACTRICTQRGLEVVSDGRSLADVTNYNQLKQRAQVVQPTHIINCAAYTNVDQAEKNPELAFMVNAVGAFLVARVAKLFDARLVHISTDYVFSGDQRTPYSEQDVPCPVNVYGASKLEGENRVLDTNPDACILRTSWVFGPKGKNFISALPNILHNQEEIRVICDQWGCLTYCSDLASVILDLIQEKGIYHFVNQGVCSRFDVAKAICDMMQERVLCKRVIPILSSSHIAAPRPQYSVLDTQKIAKKLYNPPRHWKDTLGEFFIDAVAF